MKTHIPKEIQFLAIEEEDEIHKERPEIYLPCSTELLGRHSSDSGYRQFVGHGRLYA